MKRPIFTFQWWWLVKFEEISNFFNSLNKNLFSFPTPILITIYKILTLKIPLFIAIITLIIGTLIPVRVKEVKKEITKVVVDTIEVKKEEEKIRWRERISRQIQVDTLIIYIKDTIYLEQKERHKETEKEKEVIVIKEKEKFNSYLFGETQIPDIKEQLKFGAGVELSIWRLDIFGELKINNKFEISNRVGLRFKF